VPSPVATDDVLIASLLAREEATFAALVRAWSPSMLRLARYHTGSMAVAEEVVQETWMAVVKQIADFEGRSSLRTWVLRICANIGRRYGVQENRSLAIGVLESEPTVAGTRFRGSDDRWPGHWTAAGEPADWGPEGHALTQESLAVVAAAVRRLPEKQAHVVALRDIHGFSTAEIAEMIDTSEGNVRVILHRGRAALRETLAGYFTEELGVQ
jgi:RNA polymerase sigma-70 factor, ECF subfamily